MVAALLLARQGVRVALLEAHTTFDREFRGDAVHPSTLELLDQLGLLEQVLALPHVAVYDFPVHLPNGAIVQPHREPLPGRIQATLSMRQSLLLDLLADAARQYPTFTLRIGARVEQLIEVDGQVHGVRYRASDGWHDLRARLVIGADGRFSKTRQLAGMSVSDLSQEMDVLWLKLPRWASDPARAHGIYPGERAMLVIGDRGEAWQVGFVFPKDGYRELRAAGIAALGQRIAQLAPWLADRVHHLADWDQTSLLVIQAGRARRWHRPGLLLIGDAAHVMSPVYGVGINYAIQDAIVAANVLGRRLLRGNVRSRDLAAVQRRRELPTRIMQLLQTVGEHQVVMADVPWRSRMLGRVLELKVLRGMRGRLIAFGGWSPERARDLSGAESSGQRIRRLAWSALALAESAGRSRSEPLAGGLSREDR